MRLNPAFLQSQAHECFQLGVHAARGHRAYHRAWRAHFGLGVDDCVELFNLVDDFEDLDYTNHSKWMLAALYFLRNYPTVDDLATRVSADAKTVRYHVWKWCDSFVLLDLVRHLPYEFLFIANASRRQDTYAMLEYSPGREMIPDYDNMDGSHSTVDTDPGLYTL